MCLGIEPSSDRMPTFLFFGHDGVTERQQAEEVLSLRVSIPHHLQQTVVMEDEIWISQTVPGEVHSLRLLQRENMEDTKKHPPSLQDKCES